jgi:site-specific DNA-cytosine methylase
VPSLDKHLKQTQKKKTKAARKKRAEIGDEDAAPVELDWEFVHDLDGGLDELLKLKRGESARTFFAAVKLIAALRPKLVILENVNSAPWDMYTDQIFPKLGYLARYVTLDSKQFYLPQTRQRGYLVAIDAADIGEEQAAAIASEWETQLLNSKRAPSSPISAFLRPADDPATTQARADMERKGPSNAEWALCSLRHADARQKLGLRRDDNPFSQKAMRNGRLISATYPSHSWLSFWQIQVARIIDLMDILSASAHKSGFDLAYKTAMIDVSQNVDRNNLVGTTKSGLGTKLGIVGCITPSGLAIVTDLMRPITGTEALALQGLPVEELVISTETQAQLRDLAGNAMSVTVVGAVTLAILFAVSKTNTDPKLLDRLESVRPPRGVYLEAARDECLTVGQGTDLNDRLFDLEALLTIAEQMVRQCYCPTRPSEVFVCSDCSTTACSTCRGNPEHNFGNKKPTCSKSSAEEGKVLLRGLVPGIIRLPIPPPVVLHALSTVKDDEYRSVVSEILKADTVYYFDEVKVTEVVTVCYKAANSMARLVLSVDSGCCWYIYVAPWHQSRSRLSATFDLNQPIARGKVLQEFCEIPQWSVWAHGRVPLTLRLARAANGALVASHLSLAADSNVGAPSASLLEWKALVEKSVCGTYFHRPSCGTPGNTLHIKPSSPHVSTIFMMWDSASLRNADQDHFVWTDTVRRMEPHEYRETLLRAEPTLSWDIDSGLGTVSAFWPGYWSSPSSYPRDAALGEPVPIRNVVQIHWGSTEAIRIPPCHSRGEVAQMPVLAAIATTFPDFPVSAAILSRIDTRQNGSSFYIIPATRRNAFLKMFAFLSRELRRSRTPGKLHSLPHLEDNWVPVERCQTCSVTPPEITVCTGKDEGKGPKDIIEDPDEAALFERQYQDLPRAVAVAARCLPSIAGPSAMEMRIMLQPKTLASRALAYLLQAHRTKARGSLDVTSKANTSFSVVLDYAPSFSVTDFAPFSESVRPCHEDYTDGIKPDSECDLPSSGPPRFCRPPGKGKNPKPAKYGLWPSQKEAVNWMLQRERAPIDFVKSEIEEEVVAPLNLRVLGKAEWESRFPYSSRGGVIAHDVGYGKTIVTLALLDYMREFDKGESIAERKEKADAAWSEEIPQPFEDFTDVNLTPGSFFCHLSATLIIVPGHITDQWSKEAQKFLGLAGQKLVVIKSVAALYGNGKLEKWQQAEIIVVSSSVLCGSFLDHLETVTGCDHDGLSGRTVESWYRVALRNYRILTAYYLAGRAANMSHDTLIRKIRANLLPTLVQKRRAEIDALVEKRVPEIDRRLYKKKPSAKGKGKQRADGGQTPAQSTNATTDTGSFEKWNINWLYCCSFARVVWDECSYDEKEPVPLFVAHSVANAKWLISGTPKLFGLEQVCKIASAFGIHVARPEPRIMPGLPAATKGPQLSPMSKSEEFHVFSSEVKSVVLARERHAVAQQFVAAHFRANALDAQIDIKVEEHVQPIVMSAPDFVRYHMLNQEVIDAGYDFTALPAHARGRVALKGSDITCRDGAATAKMLLGLLSCGLGQDRGSITALEEDLASRSNVLGDQMKLLWDKTMWLWRWIRELKSKLDSELEDNNSKKSKKPKDLTPVLDTLKRVEIMCESLGSALVGAGNFAEFGGKAMFQREAAIVAGQGNRQQHNPSSLHLATDSLRSEWEAHFGQDWMGDYHKNKALYTWLDFFKVEEAALEDLDEEQLRSLVEDICLLRYKADPSAAPLSERLSTEDIPRVALGPGSQTSRIAMPAGIEERIANDKHVLSSAGEDELKEFMLACIEMQPSPQTWQEAKGTFDPKLPKLPAGRKSELVGLHERLAELNLKGSGKIDRLKEILWRHEQGLSACEQYRDGRAPPDRYRDFALATGCGGKTEKQIENAHEELKRTLVHLAKTVEDLRATGLEANFVPEYSALANARDKDDLLAKKTCCGCHKLLGSASSSFLVVACGHLLCGECKSSAGFYCPVQDCPAFIRKRPVLRCSQVPQSSSKEPCTKAECVAKLIKEIPRDEYVVVFAQYGQLVTALMEAFKNAGLEALNLAAVPDSKIAEQLEKFKEGKAGQILVLDIDSETSAGSNLTRASHVIFANPYVHHDAEHQARTVRQAKGRCIRTGQTNKVHVYHFMVSGTIEEETLRGLAKDNPAVQGFFDNSDDIPWWLEEEE